MKKLIIAAAIVCAAAVSQAATFKWTSNAQAYGVAAANLTTPGHYGIGTATSDRMKAQGTAGISWAYTMILTCGDQSETLTGSITSYSSNKISQEITGSTLFELPTSGSKTYSWNIVIKGTSADGNYTYTSDAITGSAEYTSLSAESISSAAPSGWTVEKAGGPEPTPEPTSALLLLLGVAGLALKRKQA